MALKSLANMLENHNRILENYLLLLAKTRRSMGMKALFMLLSLIKSMLSAGREDLMVLEQVKMF